MSGSSPPKRSRHKIEPITLAELADTPGMSGICSFLTTIPATEPPLPHLREAYAHQIAPDAVAGAPDLPAPPATEGPAPSGGDLYTPPVPLAPAVIRPAGVSPPAAGLRPVPLIPAVPVPPPDGLPPTVGLPFPVGAVQGFSGRYKIRPVRTAQDGHSLAEQAIYQVLWAAGTEESPETRTVSMGYRHLAAAVGLDPTNVKTNLRSLRLKLAIEVAAAELVHERIGRTYRVYSPTAILERRRQAGFLWYRKAKGVELLRVSPPGGSSL